MVMKDLERGAILTFNRFAGVPWTGEKGARSRAIVVGGAQGVWRAGGCRESPRRRGFQWHGIRCLTYKLNHAIPRRTPESVGPSEVGVTGGLISALFLLFKVEFFKG